MRTYTQRRRRGFGSAEIVITAGLTMLLTFTMVSVSMHASAGWSNGAGQMMADDTASVAVQRVASDVRAGISATVSPNKSECTVVMPSVNAAGDYDRSTSGESVRFYLSDGKLFRQGTTSGTTRMARNVQQLQFDLEGNEVTISIRARQQQGKTYRETRLVTKATLRNVRTTEE
jgi:hypothetical protein